MRGSSADHGRSQDNGLRRVDPGRAIAGVMTGIGFLGAGAIIKNGQHRPGLTTAACIWLVAALGIAVGQGLYLLALITVLALLVLVVVDRFVHVSSASYHTVTLERETGTLPELVETCRERLQGLRVLASEVAVQVQGVVKVVFHVRKRGPVDVGSLVQALLAVPGVFYLWLGRELGATTAGGLEASPNTAWRAGGFRNYADHMLTPEFH